MKLEFSRQIFEKSLNIKFHENSASGELRCSMRTDGRTDRQTDMTKLIVAFRNFANATTTYVIGVFSSGIYFIPGFIIIDQLIQKLRLMDRRITYIETT